LECKLSLFVGDALSHSRVVRWSNAVADRLTSETLWQHSTAHAAVEGLNRSQSRPPVIGLTSLNQMNAETEMFATCEMTGRMIVEISTRHNWTAKYFEVLTVFKICCVFVNQYCGRYCNE